MFRRNTYERLGRKEEKTKKTQSAPKGSSSEGNKALVGNPDGNPKSRSLTSLPSFRFLGKQKKAREQLELLNRFCDDGVNPNYEIPSPGKSSPRKFS